MSRTGDTRHNVVQRPTANVFDLRALRVLRGLGVRSCAPLRLAERQPMVSEWRGRWLRALRDLRGLRRFSEMSARRCRGRATLVTMSFRGRVRMSTFSACSADYVRCSCATASSGATSRCVLSGKADSSAASAPFADGRRSLSWVRDGLGAGGVRYHVVQHPKANGRDLSVLRALRGVRSAACTSVVRVLRRVMPDGSAVSAPSADAVVL